MIRRRRIHRDLEVLAREYPKLCRDATAWGDARSTMAELRGEWGSITRVIAQLYHLGVGVSAIGRIVHMERRNVYRELYRWQEGIEQASGIHHRPPDTRA